jgi:hypothetical protein
MTTHEAVPLRSTIPARLDRLSWSPFHTRTVAGVGAAWILDGLQIELLIGIKAERQALETFAKPLSAVEATTGTVTTDG